MVADNFKFGAEKSIVVALEHDVTMASKKDLSKVGQVLQVKADRDSRIAHPWHRGQCWTQSLARTA